MFHVKHLLWKCCTAAMVNASLLAMKHGYRATKLVWVSRPTGQITNTGGDCERAKPGAIDFHRVAGATLKGHMRFYYESSALRCWTCEKGAAKRHLPIPFSVHPPEAHRNHFHSWWCLMAGMGIYFPVSWLHRSKTFNVVLLSLNFLTCILEITFYVLISVFCRTMCQWRLKEHEIWNNLLLCMVILKFSRHVCSI